MAEGVAAGDIAAMEVDTARMVEGTGAVNPDAAGGPPAGVAATNPLEAERALTAQTFLQELCSGLNRDHGPNLSVEEVTQLARTHLAPDAVTHVDGLLESVAPVTGPEGFMEFIQLERAAYRTMSLDTLLLAISPDADCAFALSMFKMKNVGPWHGKEPTHRMSEGVRIDELRFSVDGKIVEAWCNRQMFEEERELMLREPERHHPAVFDPSLLVPVPVAGEGEAGLTSPQQLMRVAEIWAEAWNMAADAGPPDPDALEALAEPNLHMMDALGLTGDDGQSHPFTAIHSLDDAKRVLTAMSQRYDVDEVVQSMAAKPGFNAVFVHWRAKLTPRPDAAAAAGGAADVAGPAAGPFMAEATDLLLFNPTTGKLRAVLQFRRPLGSDRRWVLQSSSGEGKAVPMAPEQVMVA
ncbi:hypothetical protein GPECTOR_10g805 [Gonium pectorale]|uniref:Uncharacterized protein n=1 Tax=Gonium pectorale TaxID=33097 RepID=A0A150GQM7_GONPE|nr:hypothetical protein GPECTOR_10g805 [Gonium pectorale]|eukprot:KXZ52176.1 hypothetical protein GPECTOR_10g805 [Gonium pectorale]